jgi:hypothetical protein
MVVARVASGKKVRREENSRTVGAAILHILARARVPNRFYGAYSACRALTNELAVVKDSSPLSYKNKV